MRSFIHTLLISTLAVCGLACGDDDGGDEDEELCVVGTTEHCDEGLYCEEVMGGEPTCFAPVTVRGRVLDQNDGSGIAGATVVALDINGGARSSVVVSDDEGHYAITLPVTRDADGTPLSDPITLQVAATGYQPFPTPPREALPIDLLVDEADNDDGAPERTVQNAATDVGLIALPGDRSNDGTISGTIAFEGLEPDDESDEEEDPRLALTRGALVIAVQGNDAVSRAISDVDGAFTLFNVPAGETRVEAYRAGLRVEAESVSVAGGEETEDVVLDAHDDGLSTVSGSVNIVNAEGGLTTSVVLAVESTFDANVARGITPAGLRAPNISGSFAIEDVPPGRYAVLAAFENDRLVRDPDESIAGTDIVFIDVPGDGSSVNLDESFKVTEALAVVSPGADDPDILAPDAAPTFVWADDSSEDGYELRVYDAFGEVVHEALDVPRVTGDAEVRYSWVDAQLMRGMIYQFRVVSYRDGQGTSGGRTYISATEDLRGVFQAGSPASDSDGNEP